MSWKLRTPLKRKTPLKRGPWRRRPVTPPAEFTSKGQAERFAKFMLPRGRRKPRRQPTVLQRKAWMPRQSEKRKLESEIYKLQRVRFLQEHPLCELMVTCGALSVLRNMPGVEQIPIRRKSTQVHHRRGRGRWYLDERYWLATCRDCHEYENTHRNEAVKLGLRERVYEKH